MRLYKRNWARKKRMSTVKSLSNSCTWKGRRAEIFACGFIDGSTDNNAGALNKGYDLLWNGQRVDVKSCNLYKRKFRRGKKTENCSGWWVFNKNKGYSDYYFCVCMINNIPVKYYLIPSSAFGRGITIGWKSSRYDKFKIK